MSYLQKIVNEINQAVVPAGVNHSVGIAQPLPRKSDEGNSIQLLPAYVDENGEAHYVGADDDYDTIFYHKLNRIVAGKSSINKGYGDAKPLDVHQALMSMVVFAQRNRIKKTSDELALELHMKFPEEASKLLQQQWQIKQNAIRVTDINLNTLQVFQEEYQNVGFFLKPEQFLIKVNYTIESAILKKCFINPCSDC
jgi:hypothetical protein